MARNTPPIQQFRGIDAKHKVYTGPEGELTVNTTNWTLAVHDGVTPGGHVVGAANTLVDANEKVMYVTSGGALATDIKLKYNTSTGKFDICGHDDTVVSTVTVPSSTSALKNAEVVKNPSGQAAGTYMEFTFTLADSTEKKIYADLKDLIDIYTGGDGIDVSDANVVSVKTAKTQAVKVDDSGNLEVNLGKGLKLTQATDGGYAKIETEIDATTLVSTDADNITTTGSDSGVYTAPYTGGDGITVTGRSIAVNVVADGNQIQLVDGALLVASDRGTM